MTKELITRKKVEEEEEEEEEEERKRKKEKEKEEAKGKLFWVYYRGSKSNVTWLCRNCTGR